jgi:hypothetical protein
MVGRSGFLFEDNSMPDLVITPTSVLLISGNKNAARLAEVAVSAGEVVYLNTTTSKWNLADNTDTEKAGSLDIGLALNNAGIDQPLTVATVGAVIQWDATGTVTDFYYVSATGGGVAPTADVTTGMIVTQLGYFMATNQFKLDIIKTGLAKG